MDIKCIADLVISLLVIPLYGHVFVWRSAFVSQRDFTVLQPGAEVLTTQVFTLPRKHEQSGSLGPALPDIFLRTFFVCTVQYLLQYVKGTVSRDFLLQVFFMNHLRPSP